MKLAILLAAAVIAPIQAQAAERDDLAAFRSQMEVEMAGELTVLAVCGASTGKTFIPDEAIRGWQDDAISNGRLVFTISPSGSRDIFYIDATGDAKSATLDGGFVFQFYSAANSGDFIWGVSYPQTGVTEIYNIVHQDLSPFVVMWSSTKPSLEYPTTPPVTLGPKVAAFVANCA